MPVFAGFGAIGASLGLGAATSAGAIIGGIAVSAVVGAAIGGLTAAITGGDIMQGMLFGAVGGLVVGGVFGVGIGGAISNATGYSAATGEAMAAGGGSLGAGEALTTVGGETFVKTGVAGAGAGGTEGALGGLTAGDLTTGALVTGGVEALKAGMAPDPGAVTEKDRLAAEIEREKIAASLASAGSASNFHLAERLKLQEALAEDRADEMRLAETLRSQPHRLAGGVRSAANRGEESVSAEKSKLVAGQGVTPFRPKPYTSSGRKLTALQGVA